MDWNLDSYLPEFDGPAMRAFRAELDADLAALLERAGGLAGLTSGSVEAWAQVVVEHEALSARLGHMGSYLGCLTAADTAHEGYRAAAAGFARVRAEAEKLEVELMRGLRSASDDDMEALAAHPELDGCGHWIGRLRQAAQTTMAPEQERLAADLGVDGLRAWGRLYGTLSGRLEFDMTWPDGRREPLPMSQRRSLMGRGDRAVRRAAFDGGNDAWARVEDVTAAALNAIAGTRLTLNRHRGVDHFLDVALFQAKIGRPCLEAMLEAVGEGAEVARRVLRLQAGAMGAERVHWYDLEAPLPLPDDRSGQLSWETAHGRVTEAFAAAYPALGDFSRTLHERRWVEWSPRPGKRPGAFCTGSLVTGEPRIYMTFNGTLGDVRTLAHEAGHAFHHHLMSHVRPAAHHYPMTLAESASTFAEMILTEGLLADPQVSELDKLRVLDLETSHATAFLLNIPARFDFEKAFHEARQEGEVPVRRLRELMVEAQRGRYGDVLAVGGEDPLFWASKLHFYITGVTFYNFPYTFGFLLSRGLYARFREEGPGFLPDYEAFLRASGSGPAEQVARQAIGVDLERPDFWRAAVATLTEPVARLESLWDRLGPAPPADPHLE